MSDVIISVENLGKKYRLQHQQQGRRYVALRDVIAEKAKGFFRKIGERRKENGTAADSPLSTLHSSRASHEDFWALRNVSFEVRQGEVIGIIGRNGAGKSTLLKILSRITEPTEGRICLRGRVASLLEVGTGFHPELTGRENIFLNGAILGMHRAEIKRKFDEIVAFAEVDKFLDTPVKRYSSGMYVRLAFAVAAHLEPEILIVDEVLAVGDAEFQTKCLGKMESVSRSGRTVLFVSHNMSAICGLCGRAVLLQEGKIVFDGEATIATNRYLTEALAKRPDQNSCVRDSEILEIIFENEQGGPLSVAIVDQPVVVRIKFILRTPEKAHTLMLQFSTIDGHAIWTAETTPGIVNSLRGESGVLELSVAIPKFILFPKTYFVGVGIMNYGVGPVFWDKCFRQLTVVSDKLLPHQGYDPTRLNNVVMPHNWVTALALSQDSQ
jgi:lipopolysaccharide transport system ATP-binding protein